MTVWIILWVGQILLLVLAGRRLWAGSVDAQAVGHRDASFWTTGFSLAATSVALSGTLVVSQQFFRYGAYGLLIEIGGLAGLLLLVGVAGRIRESDARTLPELVRMKLGSFYAVYSIVGVLLAELLLVKLSLQGLSALVPAVDHSVWLLSLPLLLAVIVGGSSGALGLLKVSAVRFVLYFGIFVLIGLAGVLLPDTVRPMIWPGSNDFSWGTGVFLFSLFLVPQLFGGSLYMRILASRDPRTARNGVLLALLLKAASLLLVLLFLMLAIRVVDRSVLENIGNQATGLLTLFAALAGPWPYALLVGGLGMLLVATMEIAAATWISVVLTTINKPGWRWRVVVTMTLFLLAAGLMFMPLVAEETARSVEPFLAQVYGFWVATTVVPLLLALLRRKRPAAGTLIVGFMFGGFVYIAAVFQHSPGDPLLWGMIGNVLGLLTGAASSAVVGIRRTSGTKGNV